MSYNGLFIGVGVKGNGLPQACCDSYGMKVQSTRVVRFPAGQYGGSLTAERCQESQGQWGLTVLVTLLVKPLVNASAKHVETFEQGPTVMSPGR